MEFLKLAENLRSRKLNILENKRRTLSGKLKFKGKRNYAL